jgi:hypothetical protein
MENTETANERRIEKNICDFLFWVGKLAILDIADHLPFHNQGKHFFTEKGFFDHCDMFWNWRGSLLRMVSQAFNTKFGIDG